MKEMFFRTAIVLLASIGVLGVGRISISHWTGEASCPMIGSLPACYIILIGYSLIVLSMYPRLQKAFVLFLIGWVPVAMLALTGVVGELTDVLQCPHLENGIPQCYLSAALALFIGLLTWLLFKIQAANVDS
ncbi:MAG: hypothetical protein V3S58_04225 [Nitrosomonadaceae bacterium]